jgi:hypothetical protein
MAGKRKGRLDMAQAPTPSSGARKRGLGLSDLAACFFIIGTMILLLLPSAEAHGVPWARIAVPGGAFLALSIGTLAIAVFRQVRQRKAMKRSEPDSVPGEATESGSTG